MNRTTAVMIATLAATAGYGTAAEVIEPPSRRWGAQGPARTGGDAGRLGPSVKVNPKRDKQKAQRKARKANRR